jgi:hypothetical protein
MDFLWPLSGLVVFLLMAFIGIKKKQWTWHPQRSVILVIGSLLLGPMMILVLLGTWITCSQPE